MPQGRLARLLHLLAHRRSPAVVVAVATLIALPALQMGLYSDDYGQLAQIEHTIPAFSDVAPWDLYRFIPADRATYRLFMEVGPMPWFSDPDLKLHFFRPLSSLLLALDHALWGRRAIGYHVTSILLYAAAVAAAGLFFRAVARAPREGSAAVTAVLASILFAVDAGHFQPIGWTAGRHLLVAALPACLALAAHVRATRDGWAPGRWLAPTGMAVALLGSEAALGAVAYWLAYDAFGPGFRSRRDRLHAAIPVLAVVAIYTVIYKLGRFGAAGSGVYLDPATEPLAFAAALPARLAALLADTFTHAPADFSFFAADLYLALGLTGAVATVTLYALVRPAVPEDERAALRWLLPGSIAAMILAAGGFPGSRLLLFPGLGAAYLVAVLIRRGTDRLAERRSILIAAGRAYLILVHLILGPLFFLGSGPNFADLARQGHQIVERAEVSGSGLGRVVILSGSDPLATFYPATVVALEQPARAGSWNVISLASHDHRAIRTGRSSFHLDVLGGRMLDGPFERVFRSARRPFRVGDKASIRGGTVTVAAIDRGAPTAVDVDLDVDLDDPGLFLLTWRDGHLARIKPPPVGASVDLPWSPGPYRFF